MYLFFWADFAPMWSMFQRYNLWNKTNKATKSATAYAWDNDAMVHRGDIFCIAAPAVLLA